MATKKKEWSRRALCVGNQNKLRQSLWLHGNDKVTLAIKSLLFFFVRNTRVTQSKLLKRMEKLVENYEMWLYLLVKTAQRARSAFTQTQHLASFN